MSDEYERKFNLSIKGVKTLSFKGEKGEKGETGETGPQGESIKGNVGERGPVGDKGVKGDKGDKGLDGINGIDGINGSSGSPDTGDQIIEKLNPLRNKLDFRVLTNIPDFVLTRDISGRRDQGGGGGSIIRFNDSTGAQISQYVSGLQFGTGISQTYSNGIITLTASGGGGTWGSITGTLSNQTDLQTALNAKQNTITTGTTLQYFRGDLSLATFPTNVSTFTNDSGYLTDAPSDGSTYGRKNGAWSSVSAGSGTVTTVSVATANGFSGTVANATTTPAITIIAGAITPNTVVASDTTTPHFDTVTGSTNTGYFLVNGKTSGSFKITTADATAQAITLTVAAQTTGAATLTIPDMAHVNKTVAWLESPVFTTPNIGSATGNITGLAGTATALATARAIWGQNFDGTGAISGAQTGLTTMTGGANNMTITAGTGNSRTMALQTTTSGGVATTFLSGDASQNTLLAGNLTLGASTSTITGAAGNMTIVAGTGNSRTLIMQTTTSGGTATTALTLNADQSATFAAGATLGGTLAMGANSITISGSIGVTGTRITKAWHTDCESTNMYTVGGTSLSSTFSAIAGSASIVTVGTITTGTWSATTIAVNKGGTGVTSVTIAPGASVWAGWDANSNMSANNLIEGWTTTALAAGTTVMVVGNTYQQYWTGASSTQTVKLPTTGVVAGMQWQITNSGTGTSAVTVQSSGANTIVILAVGTSAVFTALVATPTTAANWAFSYQSVSAATGKVASFSNNLTLAGTDGTTITFPTTSATIARTDAANTFTGVQTFSTPIAVGSVATMTATVGGGVPTPPNNTTTFLRGDGTFAAPTAASKQAFIWGQGATTLNSTQTTFFGADPSSGSATEANAKMVIAIPGTIKNFFTNTATAQPANNSITLTMRKNGVDQTVTLTIAASAAAGVFSDTTHSFTVAAGDLIDVKVVNAANTTSAQFNSVSFEFDPT